MFNELTPDHSLYVIDENTFNLFITEANRFPLNGYVSNAVSLNSVNNSAIVLQIWCLVNEKELKLWLNHQKMMPYSIDHYILNLLRSNRKIEHFLKSRQSNQTVKFILAYYLACATLKWGDTIILEHKKGQTLCKTNQARDYFIFAQHENLNNTKNHEFYYFQKTIINLMAEDNSKLGRLDPLIDQALLRTRHYLYTQAYENL